MSEVMELRCLLEEGQIIKHIMTIAVTLMIVEAGVCITAIARYLNRDE
jgi:hypothetical protein